MNRPSVKDVSEWSIAYSDENVIVSYGTAKHHDIDFDVYRVKPLKFGSTKYYWGESAWMKAQRNAWDYGALDCIL